MTSRVALALGFALIVCARTSAYAQAIPGQPVTSQAPPRDTRPAATGTAVIRGRVVAAETGRPLRRARIRVTGPELGPQGMTTSTNPDGKYEIKDLPAGRYTLQVSRSGYLQLNYGQRRPFEQGKPLQVADKQIAEKIDFALPRTSVITGRIVDELGDPVADAEIYAMRTTFFQGRRRLALASQFSRTDDAGQYRIAGLGPGSYVVMALLNDTWTMSEHGVDVTFGYAPSYYPGTSAQAEARRITVGIGQELGAMDFSLVPGRSATVSGSAFDSRGRPLAGRSVGVQQEVSGPNGASFRTAGSGTVAPDGTFTIRNVAPGSYKLRAQTTIEGGAPGTQTQEAVVLPIVVDGIDLKNISLTTTSGWSASGRVVLEGGGSPEFPRDRIRVAGRSVDADTAPNGVAFVAITSGESGRVKDDWTFTVNNIFGAARLQVTLPDGWAVKSILNRGADVSDAVVDLKSGEELSDLQVVVTDRVTSVSGQLTDDKGAPLADGTVILFPADAERWFENSRWVRSERPDQDGRYQIKGLPPGDYLAVAVDYVENGMWNDSEYLDSIRRYGQKFTLLDAGSQALSLKLVTP